MFKKLTVISVLILLIFVFAAAGISAVEKKKKEDLFREVELFSDSLAIVQSDYVDEVSAHTLIYGALKGMISSLDPHSQFMDPETYNELKVETEGKFGGLGIEITIKDGLLTVVTPIEDTPAWKAGIKANDRIVKINSELTRDMTLTDAVKRLRGKPGEAVNITVLRESDKKLLDFKITRDIIKIVDIKDAKIIDDKIGYVRLAEFRENTAADLSTALTRLNKEGMTALVLDLRNNPGGLLDSAIRVCEKFIEKGKLMLSTQGRIPSQNLQFFSRSKNPILDIPIAVLINEGSASGSEIVAGCLQDYKRAIIVGKKSFGKGSVQTVIPLGDGSAIRLTTSKYLTPKGQQIHGKGVTPDIEIEEGTIQAAPKNGTELENGKDVFEELENREKNLKDGKEGLSKLKEDNQLIRAVDILKAIRIYNKNKT